MAIGLCDDDDDDDDDDDGGDDPLIRELDSDNLASWTPADLLEPSQPSTVQGHISSDPVTAPEVNTQGGEREVLNKRFIQR